ncbi:polysaccharide deacetylase family protein [Streptacidiphilus fuscans]|uniref:Polysaccharide deacetylase family protein n=1 Tax=Streptacidiphilus fuscans TaxID=2789292 RepID=A0A931B601_9ACTN|nr:polysaccharide deacetylase family protein [Streptacidiphilus fuscans]MBF9067530.1 polysaccharide deacetylase family protein [Streptacidiphilus fuscans]
MSPLDRRALLRGAALGAAGTVLSACASGTDARPSPARSGTPAAPTPDASSATRTATASQALAALPFEIQSGPKNTDRVALTFHGQGDPAIARDVLAEAERAGARITVMAVGSWLDAYPEMARRILDGGHELGNHTQNHLAISSLSPDQAYAEIDRCAQRLRQLTGSIGTWFRPSQAQDCTSAVEAQARRVGYGHCLSYDVDSLDWQDPGAGAVTRTVLDQTRAGSVVSMHFGHTGTVAALPAILAGLHQRRLSAVTTSELLS